MKYLEITSSIINGLNNYVKNFDDILLEMLFYIEKEQVELETEIEKLKKHIEFENITAKMNKITKININEILKQAKSENVRIYYVEKDNYYLGIYNLKTKNNRYYLDDKFINKKKLTDLLVNDNYYIEA